MVDLRIEFYFVIGRVWVSIDDFFVDVMAG